MSAKRESGFTKLQSPLLTICIIGAFCVGIAFSALGVLLVYLGSQGQTDITLFQLSFHSASVGIAAIFIGAGVTLYIVHTVLIIFEKLKDKEGGSNSRKNPRLNSELAKLVHRMAGQKGDEYGEDTKL